MKKGKHAKKRKYSFLMIVVVLFSLSAFSTGTILGWQFYNNEHSQIVAHAQSAQKKLILTTNEQQLVEKIDQLLRKNDYIGSIYVKKNNRIIMEKGYGYANKLTQQPNDPSLYYQIGSVQKALTTLLILKQVERGHLSLDTKLAQFYPQIAGSQQITIRDLLYMRSGLHRTASPTIPMTDEEVVQFAIQHLKFTDYQTSHYDSLNFTILTGTLIKLTNQPYEKLLTDDIIEPLGLQHTKFYDQVKNSSNHALSYQMSKEDDYFKPLTESETEIHNELGTGNISMSVYDLNTLFTQVLSGKLVSKDLLFSLWRENANGHPYSGGVYSGDNYILSQGNIDSFDTASVFSKDSQDAVIMESNVKPDKTIKLPTGYLRNQIYDLMEETNKLATS